MYDLYFDPSPLEIINLYDPYVHGHFGGIPPLPTKFSKIIQLTHFGVFLDNFSWSAPSFTLSLSPHTQPLSHRPTLPHTHTFPPPPLNTNTHSSPHSKKSWTHQCLQVAHHYKNLAQPYFAIFQRFLIRCILKSLG